MLSQLLSVNANLITGGDLLNKLDALDGTMDGKLDLTQLNASSVKTNLDTAITKLNDVIDKINLGTNPKLDTAITHLSSSLTKLDSVVTTLNTLITATNLFGEIGNFKNSVVVPASTWTTILAADAGRVLAVIKNTTGSTTIPIYTGGHYETDKIATLSAGQQFSTYSKLIIEAYIAGAGSATILYAKTP
jgi:hypothetical protein